MVEKILDLFAGAGGLSLGFELLTDDSGEPLFELHRAVEFDKYCCATLRNRHPVEKIIEGDLTDKKIHDRVIEECRDEVSIVMGGIPCQSFSLLGPRSGSDKRREKYLNDKRDNLYKEFRDIVGQLKPKIFLIENVKGILSKKDESGSLIIKKIFTDFEKLGYNLINSKTGKKFMVLNAADYGVPQTRNRVMIIGIRKDLGKDVVPFIETTQNLEYELSLAIKKLTTTKIPFLGFTMGNLEPDMQQGLSIHFIISGDMVLK